MTIGYVSTARSSQVCVPLPDNRTLPKYIEVTGIFTPRGGISIYPYANYGRPGTKFEQMAEHRLMNRE